ncbi:MAG: tRNA lysidine(34) synthetase TilS [Oscillospiraceae bacterium]|jgi:tRNA(Ile)-lysidine synthase|nr:tRNA lysidine(34) synthetase TilS [Oscillospiraceae bacterium]
MIKKIIRIIEKYDLANKSQKITIALSGGADSTALLLVMKELGYNINAVHINHGIRGDEAKRDEIFCGELCFKLNIPLDIRYFNVPEIAYEKKKGIEETAREIRYEVFGENELTATAHNADDNAETVLFNLIRGTGIKGLCGIPPKRQGIIRPLIECTRREIEDFLNHRNQRFIIDSTNLSDDYTRNNIRHNIIPKIKEINPNFAGSVTKTVNALKLDNDFLNSIAFELTKDTPKALRHRIIEKILIEKGYFVNFGKINDLDNIFMKTGSIFEGDKLKGERPL